MRKPTFKFENNPVWKGMLKVLRFIIFISAAICIVVMVAAVIMRYIFHADFLGYEDILLTVILWMYYCGAAYATYNETHIKGDVCSVFFKTGAGQKFYKLSIQFFSLIVMAFWVVWGWQYVVWNYQAGGTTSALHIPLIVAQVAIYIGILGLFFFCIFNTVKYLKMKPEDFIAEEGVDA